MVSSAVKRSKIWPSTVKKGYFLPSKMQIDINRQKDSRHFNRACFSISADRAQLKINWDLILSYLIVMDFWLLKNQAPNCKTSSHVLKNTPSRHYKTLELAYIWNYFEILLVKGQDSLQNTTVEINLYRS